MSSTEPLRIDPERLNRSERRAVRQAKAAPWIAALSVPMFAAAIWTDWRWAATSALAVIVAAVTLAWSCIKHEAIKRARADLTPEKTQ